MIELYLAELALKTERALLDRQSARRAAELEQRSLVVSGSGPGVRRQLACLLLLLADRLDPRPVLCTARTPGRPRLNGTLHQA